ncbi:hypothetical protein VCSRO96_3028 [Vibrio cholerae]|nr:hypothetical protein VCSRO96_3028 [Vibrio cholerae]
MCFEVQLENLFFVTNSVAGRCGPDKVMWDLEELWSSGVRAIISVNDGESVHISRLKAIDFAYEHIPLSNNAPQFKVVILRFVLMHYLELSSSLNKMRLKAKL